MNQPASLRSDRVADIPWNGWPTCTGLSGRNRLDYVADFTGMRRLIIKFIGNDNFVMC